MNRLSKFLVLFFSIFQCCFSMAQGQQINDINSDIEYHLGACASGVGCTECKALLDLFVRTAVRRVGCTAARGRARGCAAESAQAQPMCSTRVL